APWALYARGRLSTEIALPGPSEPSRAVRRSAVRQFLDGYLEQHPGEPAVPPSDPVRLHQWHQSPSEWFRLGGASGPSPKQGWLAGQTALQTCIDWLNSPSSASPAGTRLHLCP